MGSGLQLTLGQSGLPEPSKEAGAQNAQSAHHSPSSLRKIKAFLCTLETYLGNAILQSLEMQISVQQH